MTAVSSIIPHLRNSSVARQTLSFVWLSSLGAAVSTLTVALIAHGLSTRDFGAFTLSKSILTLTALVFEFGIFFPAARLTALASSERDSRAWLGATLLAYLPLGLLYSATIALVSFAVDPIFNVEAGSALLLTAPFAVAYPFGLVALSVSQGTGRAYLQPLMSTIAGGILAAGLVFADDIVGAGSSLNFVLALRGAGFIVAALVITILLRPLLEAVCRRWRRIWKDTRRWGLQAYGGRMISVGTYNLDVLMVGALTDAKQLGAYGLAGAASSLISLPAVGVSTALFPRMTKHQTLDRRPITLVVGLGVTGTVIGALASGLIIRTLLNPALDEAAVLLIPLGLAATVRAVTSILNTYLNARAAGSALRNTSIILFVSNMALNPLLIIPLGAMGAALASLIAMLLNFAGYVYYIRKLPPPDLELHEGQ